MKTDEFFFFNQQLGEMLRAGLPLESSLRQLCQNLQSGALKTEFSRLETDLSKGTPLDEALGQRKLPSFYVMMLKIGARGDDFPGMLTMLADYYQRVNGLWTRLKGVTLYPILVLAVSLGLSIWVAFLYVEIAHGTFRNFHDATQGARNNPEDDARDQIRVWMNLWAPPLLMTTALAFLLVVLSRRSWRRSLCWRVPVFRDASLAQFASAMALVLKNGAPFPQALRLLGPLEEGTSAAGEIQIWEKRAADGAISFTALAAGGKAFPPLFVWLVSSAGEDFIKGFRRAADIYSSRAQRRAELLLNAVLPVSLLVLGFMIMGQIYPFVTSVYDFFTPVFKLSRIFG